MGSHAGRLGGNLGDACGRRRTSKCTGNNLKAVIDSVFSRWSRDGKIGMLEFNCVGYDLALGVCIDKLEAAVGIHGWTNVEAILGTKSQERRVAGLAWMRTRQPTGPNGVLLKSKGPWKNSHAFI